MGGSAALGTAEFFELLFQLANEDELDANGMPSMFQLAVMVPEFGDEIRPVSLPWPVLRPLMTALAPIVRARGYRARGTGRLVVFLGRCDGSSLSWRSP